MSTSEIMNEVDRRVLAEDIKHSQKRLADLDAQIAKLQKQRDRVIEYIGRDRQRLDEMKAKS